MAYPDQLQKSLLKTLVRSREWNEGLVPILRSKLESATSALLQGTQRDDLLRGQISVLAWLYEGLPLELEREEETPKPDDPAVGNPYGEVDTDAS